MVLLLKLGFDGLVNLNCRKIIREVKSLLQLSLLEFIRKYFSNFMFKIFGCVALIDTVGQNNLEKPTSYCGKAKYRITN